MIDMEMVHDLQSRLMALEEANATLVQQKACLQGELEQLNSEFDSQNKLFNENLQELKSYHGIIIELKQTIANVEGERDEAGKQALAYSEQLGKSQLKNDELTQELGITSRRLKDVEGQLLDQQRSLQQISKEIDQERLETMRKVKRAEDRVRELQTVLLSKSAELETTQESLRKVKKELTATRKDAEGMTEVLRQLINHFLLSFLL